MSTQIPEEWQLRCENCGYLLTGLPTSRCPECGTPFDADALRETRLDAAKCRRRSQRIGMLLVGAGWGLVFVGMLSRGAIAENVALSLACVLFVSALAFPRPSWLMRTMAVFGILGCVELLFLRYHGPIAIR